MEAAAEKAKAQVETAGEQAKAEVAKTGEEAKAAQAVIEAHEHHVLPSEVLTVVHGRRATAVDEAAPVKPDHHGQRLCWPHGRCPDVEHETILGGRRAEWGRVARKRLLHAVVAILIGRM
jgi:hypothetical protein